MRKLHLIARSKLKDIFFGSERGKERKVEGEGIDNKLKEIGSWRWKAYKVHDMVSLEGFLQGFMLRFASCRCAPGRSAQPLILPMRCNRGIFSAPEQCRLFQNAIIFFVPTLTRVL